LSVSLTDIKKPNNNSKLNTINSVADDEQKKDLKHFSSQNFILNQNSKLKTFELNHNKAKENRLNRLFRRLFTFNRKIKSSSPLSSSTNTPMTMLDQQQHDISYYNNEVEEDTSRFVRFFSSFRSSISRKNMNTNKNELPILKIASPITAAATEIDSSQNLPHISLNKSNFVFIN
jgi:hypothetical protein